MQEIVIRSLGDGSEIKRMDVTGKSERQLEQIERGLAINFNFGSYYWAVESTNA